MIWEVAAAWGRVTISIYLPALSLCCTIRSSWMRWAEKGGGNKPAVRPNRIQDECQWVQAVCRGLAATPRKEQGKLGPAQPSGTPQGCEVSPQCRSGLGDAVRVERDAEQGFCSQPYCPSAEMGSYSEVCFSFILNKKTWFCTESFTLFIVLFLCWNM